MFVENFLILFLINLSNSAKILGIYQIPFYSHQSFHHKIVRELSLRGHEVKIFTTHKMNLEGLSNISQHHFNESVEIYEKYPGMMEKKLYKMNDFNFYMYHQMRAMYEVTKNQLQHTEMQNLIKTDEKFDLILIECIFCPFMVFSEVFDCPVIVVTSGDVKSNMHKIFGNDISPSKHPTFSLPYLHNNLTFWQKIHSWMIYLWMENITEPLHIILSDYLKNKFLEGGKKFKVGL